MKIFISWSGSKSNAAAIALRDWLPDVIQKVEPWVSESDISAGARWGREIANELQETTFGVICLTKGNANAPWLLFEAGALAKTLEDTYVCPYLIDMESSDIPDGPLTQFQWKRADKTSTLDLILTINQSLKDDSLPKDKVEKAFEKWWPDLKKKLNELPDEESGDTEARDPDDMIKEILEDVRWLTRVKLDEMQDAPFYVAGGGGQVIGNALASPATIYRNSSTPLTLRRAKRFLSGAGTPPVINTLDEATEDVIEDDKKKPKNQD